MGEGATGHLAGIEHQLHVGVFSVVPSMALGRVLALPVIEWHKKGRATRCGVRPGPGVPRSPGSCDSPRLSPSARRPSGSTGPAAASPRSASEYGMGTKISIEGDVYSFGVLLLEMLTGRRPTDTFFDDATSLPKFVEMTGPENLLEIMDANITSCENPQEMVQLLIAPVSKLGLSCCRDSARKRLNMGDVVRELGVIKKSCESFET